MVSNARLDLPEPERPVTTIRAPRGSSRETFFRLCTRAPWTAMVVRAAGLAGFELVGIGRFGSAEESHLVDGDGAAPGEAEGDGSFADEAEIGEIFAGESDAFQA